MIQAAARARYVPIIRSEDFADMLIEKLEEDPERTQAFEGLTVGEVEEWEALLINTAPRQTVIIHRKKFIKSFMKCSGFCLLWYGYGWVFINKTEFA